MIPKQEGIQNFLRFYLDPDLLSREEAKEALKENGIDIESIEEKGKLFIKRLEAKQALREAKFKKEEFLNIVEEFKKEETDNLVNKKPGEYRIAARKQNNENIQENNGELDDAKLLKRLKEKNKQ